MIERRLQEFWSSVQVYHQTLRTPAQRLIWLDRFLEPLAWEVPGTVRDRLLAALEHERQKYDARRKEEFS